MLKMYTVVGYYSDTGLTYVGHCKAFSAEDAILAPALLIGCIEVVAVLEGHHRDQAGLEHAVNAYDFSLERAALEASHS